MCILYYENYTPTFRNGHLYSRLLLVWQRVTSKCERNIKDARKYYSITLYIRIYYYYNYYRIYNTIIAVSHLKNHEKKF